MVKPRGGMQDCVLVSIAILEHRKPCYVSTVWRTVCTRFSFLLCTWEHLSILLSFCRMDVETTKIWVLVVRSSEERSICLKVRKDANIYDVVGEALQAEFRREFQEGTISAGMVKVSQGQENVRLDVQVTDVNITYDDPLVLNCAEGMCHYTWAVIINTSAKHCGASLSEQSCSLGSSPKPTPVRIAFSIAWGRKGRVDSPHSQGLITVNLVSFRSIGHPFLFPFSTLQGHHRRNLRWDRKRIIKVRDSYVSRVRNKNFA